MSIQHLHNPAVPLLNTYRDALVDFDGLQRIPEPTWLINNILVSNSLAMLFADSGAGKSFLALDWAMSLATGKAWFGKPVERAGVFYIFGEGGSGMKKRANAWALAHDAIPGDDEIQWLRRMPDLLDETTRDVIKQLIAEQHAINPVGLIIIDTLARAMTGHSENDTTDMGRFVAVGEELREAFGATVLLVHHSTKSNNNMASKARGNASLHNAVDCEFEIAFELPDDLEDITERRILRCRKQKDSAKFRDIDMWLVPSGESLVPRPWKHEVVY